MVTPLKTERLRRKVTVATLASAVGVQRPTISRIENGRMRASPPLANKIAQFFDQAVTRDQVLFPEDYVTQVTEQKAS